jgi:hypothetical protein
MRRMAYRLLIVSMLALSAGVVACGGSTNVAPTPLPSAAQPSSVDASGPVLAHSWACAVEFRTGAGAVSVRVAPASSYLQVAAGTCAAPGSVLADSNAASLTYPATAGEYHVNVGNPTDTDERYTVHADFLLP